MKKLCLIIGVIIALLPLQSVTCQGQDEYNFLPEKEAYQKELARFFDKYGTQNSKVILDEFINYTRDTELEENEWIAIAEISNYIISRQVSSYSCISGFIQAITSFKFNPDRNRNFPVWSQQVRSILKQEKKELERVASFCTFTTNLHQENLLFSSPTIRWKISSSDYRFIYRDEFYIQTGNINLIGFVGKDSSRIQSTTGKFYPFNQKWSATGGKISWERVGMDNNLAFIRLDDYLIDLSRSVYTLDSVNLIDRRHFDHPILGKFDEKIVVGVKPELSGYPRFSSYEVNNRIKSIFPNMDYTGGYSLEGLKTIGSGESKGKGELIVFQEDNPIMQLTAQRFVFDEEGAKGLNTATHIYIDSDSIIHPGLFFQYKKAKNELVLMRDGTGSSNSRFFDSFHQLTLDVEMLKWSPGDSLLYLSGMFGSLENIAAFVSADFFSLQWFNEIQMADLKNPLVLVKQCADLYQSRFFFSSDLSEFMKRPLHLVEEMLFNVSYQGFVRYDPKTKMVQVLQRTYDFLQQHSGNMDYDIIKFNSNILPPNPNGVINLRTGSMKVYGVPSVELSHSRSVQFHPTGEEISIDRGRDMTFDGKVEAGLLSFEGSDFIFNYEDFQLHLNTVDVIRLKVHIPLDKNYQETMIVDLSSVIENTNGVLLIDAPDNKAGLEPEKTPQFPQFRFDTTAYVYYDQKIIQNGAYTRDSFYFEIDPTVISGLNDLHFKDNLFLPGTFKTYNIFPPLKLDLVYRDDNSLGFDTLSTPVEGYPVYIDRGIFYNEISMSTQGLRGNGTLSYLGSTIISDDFLFLPDQVRIQVVSLAIKKNSSELGNPEVVGQNLTAVWFPKDNSLTVGHKDNSISLYSNGEFIGELYVEPEALRGAGILYMDEFTASSDNFTFLEERIEVEDGRFTITSNFQDSLGKPKVSEEADFIANHVSGSVDLKNRMAEFSGTEDQTASLLFPINKYQSDQSSFKWDMTGNKLFLEKSRLTSTRKDQNSLSFEAENSIYDINSYTIEANNVPFIDVADVRVYPGTDKAVIRSNANLDSLPGCTIMPQDTSLSHEFRNTLVQIRGKNNYSGSGNYVYTDISGRELLLPFSEIGARPGRQSEGQAFVDSVAPFMISPEFAFQGTVEWKNNEDLLRFDGSFNLTQDCPNFTEKWIRFNSQINPSNVIIPIDSLPKSIDRESLFQGFYLSNQPVELYSTFLGPHIRYSDHPVISTFGQVSYDYVQNQYLIWSGSLQDSVQAETVLSFDRDKCLTKGTGPLDLGLDLGQLKLITTGEISHDMVNDSIFSDQVMAVDFFLDEKLLSNFANSINNTLGLQPVNYSRQSYKYSIINWLGKEKGQELLNELSLMGSFRKVPEEFNHTLLLTDLKMKWNPVRGSYQSVGKIGIGNIQDQSVNKLVDGHLELVHRRGGDTFTLYVELDPNSYYYFYYNRGLMQVLAGPANENFNNRVRDIKPKKRRMKSKAGEPRYEFALGQFRLVRTFLDEINLK